MRKVKNEFKVKKINRMTQKELEVKIKELYNHKDSKVYQTMVKALSNM
jgi:hypothetical protein